MVTNQIILGIGGVSTAGKSRLADWIALQFSERNPTILHQDDLCFPENELPRIRERADWETPKAIDFNKTMDTVREAKKVSGLIIHEGYMAFYFEELNRYYTHGIFMNISKSTFLERKEKDHRWGDEPSWYIEHIWKSYLLYGQPPENLNNLLIINAEHSFNRSDISQFLV